MRIEANEERSAKDKHYLAMSKTQLGFIYGQGLGVEQNVNKAFYLFRWAARKGRIPQAMYNLEPATTAVPPSAASPNE